MSERDEDQILTQRITKLDWLRPVARVEDLPTEGVSDGAYCFVETEGEEEVWQYRGGRWVRVDAL